MKLSIVAIKNHPDICGVVEYLENLDLVPAQYGDLAFTFPSSEYAESFDAPIEWYKSRRSNCVVVNPDTGMSAYVAYSKSADTIVALADVLPGTPEMPSMEEQAISLHILNLLERNGYDRRDIDVVYTNDDDPVNDDPVQDLMDAMVPPAVAEGMTTDAFLRCIPDAVIEEGPHEIRFDGAQVSQTDIKFTFAGEKFTCRFKRTYKMTDREREDFMFVWPDNRTDDELCIKDPYNAREEIVNFYFNFAYYIENEFNNRLAEFEPTTQKVDLDGTIEWTGTYRGNRVAIQCKDKKFSMKSLDGDDFFAGNHTFDSLVHAMDDCIPEKDTECPLCSGKEVTFGSESLHFQRDGRTSEVNVYKDGLYAGCAEWKFCPLCSRPLGK